MQFSLGSALINWLMTICGSTCAVGQQANKPDKLEAKNLETLMDIEN